MKTFLLCPGLERAGTSWLYNYLKNNKLINFGDIKEYHYFDSLYLDFANHYKKLNIKHDIFYKFYDNDINYYKYFNTILNDYNITGDFSPGYSALDQNILLDIKNSFNKLQINTKIIFLIRNPVSRHISATNMRVNRDHLFLSDEEYNKILVENINDKTFMVNKNFIEDIQKFKNIFNDNLLVIKYENLFTNKSIIQICDFLNIDYIDRNFNQKINESKQNNIIYERSFNFLNNHYKNEINFYNNYYS